MPTKQELTEMLRLVVIEFCQGCAADGDVEDCQGDDCPLYAARLGRLPPRKAHGWLLQQIRSRCLDCMADQAREILHCQRQTCPLWPWRDGTGIPLPKNEAKGLNAFLFGDRDPDELTVNDILFGED
jgi:hypothetical protein